MIHASSVSELLRSRLGESGTVTMLLLPLKASALPYLPVIVQVAPEIVPVLLWPEASFKVVPLPSLKL